MYSSTFLVVTALYDMYPGSSKRVHGAGGSYVYHAVFRGYCKQPGHCGRTKFAGKKTTMSDASHTWVRGCGDPADQHRHHLPHDAQVQFGTLARRRPHSATDSRRITEWRSATHRPQTTPPALTFGTPQVFSLQATPDPIKLGQHAGWRRAAVICAGVHVARQECAPHAKEEVC